jgi:hypothetical protein
MHKHTYFGISLIYHGEVAGVVAVDADSWRTGRGLAGSGAGLGEEVGPEFCHADDLSGVVDGARDGRGEPEGVAVGDDRLELESGIVRTQLVYMYGL